MKRFVDIILSGFFLILLFPVVLIIAALVKANLGSPILFRQERPGLNSRPFIMTKFRTMTAATSPTGELLPDSERLTRFGRFLRSTSLDELPELWNVFLGNMSLVGPRPLLMQYLPLYSAEQSRRHEIRPGLTGLAQVKGRNDLSWEERLGLDVWYVDNQSMRLDIAIIISTVKLVFSRTGVNARGSASMPPFLGSQ
jgi:lipopolysaccharide/colanic/teichoic acid biosynthesis glycosyltransferase